MLEDFKNKGPNDRLAFIMLQGQRGLRLTLITCEAGKKSDVKSVYSNEDEYKDEDEDVVSADALAARERADAMGVPLADDTNTTFLPRGDMYCGRAMAAGGSSMLVCGSKGHGELLPYSVHVTSGRALLGDDAAPNICLARLLGEHAASHWRDSVIIYAMTKVAESYTMVDISTGAFTLALNAMAAETSPAPLPPKKIRAVSVSAAEPHFQELNVPTAHPLFTKGPLCKVTNLIGGFPMRTYKQPSLTSPGSAIPTTAPDDPVNPAAWLHLNIDSTSRDFATIPSAIKTDPTTLLVAVAKSGTSGYRDTDVEYVDSAIELIRDDVLRMLRDAGKTPEERCRGVRARGEAMFGLYLSIAGFTGVPMAGPPGGEQQDISSSADAQESQQAAEPTAGEGEGGKGETEQTE